MLNEKTKYMTNETNNSIAKIHELAKRPAKCSLDEVAHAFFAALRVENWEELSNEFGGYKVGAIYAFILGLIEQHIADTLDAREMAKEALFQNHISEGKQ